MITAQIGVRYGLVWLSLRRALLQSPPFTLLPVADTAARPFSWSFCGPRRLLPKQSHATLAAWQSQGVCIDPSLPEIRGDRVQVQIEG